MNNSQIASRIKDMCKEKNISISQVLSECGLTKSFVYDLEKRNTSPSCDKINKIADYLGCSVDYLLGRTDIPNPEKEGDIDLIFALSREDREFIMKQVRLLALKAS